MKAEKIAEWSEVKIVETKKGPVEFIESGQGPAVLAVHGAMGGYDQSMILAKTISEGGYRFIAVSRPGYFNTPLESGKTPEEQADLHAALLDCLGIESAAVMAISGGGPSSIHFGLRYPERCRGLVLASTCGGPIRSKIPISFKITCFLARFPAVVKWMKEKTMKDPKRAASRGITDPNLLEKTMQNSEAWDLYLELMESTFNNMAGRLAGTVNDIESTREITFPLEEITVPTLVVHGTKDTIVPYDQHGKILAERIPHAELLCIDGGEHTTIFTHRDVVRKTVSEFLQKQQADS